MLLFFFFVFKNEIISFFKEIIYFGFKNRFFIENLNNNDKKNFLFENRENLRESFKESFYVVDKNLFLSQIENNG